MKVKQEEWQKSLAEQIHKVDELVTVIHAWIQREQEVTLRKKWVAANAGEDLQLPNFPPKTMYVDNSSNGNSIQIQLDGEIGVWNVGANGSLYIPCEGVRSVQVIGVGQTKILFINRILSFN